jgi:peroxiredoxin
MNRPFLLSVLFIAAIARGQAASQPADASGLVGQPAPPFLLPDLDGKTHSLADAKGSVVVLDFWATWCVPCHLELPHLDAMYQKLSPNGLKMYAIDTNDDVTKAGPYIKANHLSLPVLLDADTTAAAAYRVDEQPETVIVAKDGTIANVFVGFPPDAEAKMEQAVTEAMSK